MFNPMLLDLDKLQGSEIPAAEGLPADVIVSPDTRRPNRVPPRQARTRKWPVLDAFGAPAVVLRAWRLQIFGLVEQPLTLDWEQFRSLPRVRVFSDFHCVTRWTRLGNLWEGVAAAEILRRARPLPQAHFVVAHGYDSGWTTNLPISYFHQPDVLLADTHDSQPISAAHGGPLRLVVPRLYAWKSAKWLRAIEFVSDDRPGFWEEGGYHNVGNPWLEQRFRGNQ